MTRKQFIVYITLVVFFLLSISSFPDAAENEVPLVLKKKFLPKKIPSKGIQMNDTVFNKLKDLLDQLRTEPSGSEEEKKSNERFSFAFFQSGVSSLPSKIHVRWSDDGLTWNDGNFPDLGPFSSTPLLTTHGVGLAAKRPDGIFHWLLFDKPNHIDTVWGLGPALWDNSSVSVSSGIPASAPEAVDLGGDLRFIVYQQNGKVVGNIYDHNSREFIVSAILESGSLNSNVSGRPSIAFHNNGKILIAWRRFTQGFAEIVTAVGELSPPFNLPVFPSHQIQTVDLPSEGFTKIDSDPDVTHDKDKFYMTTVREERSSGAGGLHGWQTVVYSSLDGLNWNEEVRTSFFPVTNSNKIEIASKSDGTMIIATIRKLSNGSIQEAAGRMMRENGVWKFTGINNLELWGGKQAAWKEFSLIRYGSDLPVN